MLKPLSSLIFIVMLITGTNAEASSSLGNSERFVCHENCSQLVSQLKKFARNGSPDAQTLLALSYRSGELLDTIDPDKAWKWMKRAKLQDHPDALFYISGWYRNGYETEVDIERANGYLERSAKMKYTPAQLDYGILLLKRNEVENGIAFIEEAARKSHPRAKQIMSAINASRNSVDKELKVAKSPDTASVPELVDAINHQPNDEVLTIYGSKKAPQFVFASLIEGIRDQKIYADRGTTGARLSDRKCGQKGSGCKVFRFDNSSLLSGEVR